jgi:hypothetical protein
VVEKLGPIKNPLTVIAIFAGLAEVSGTAVLPLMAPQTQQTYVWFLMAFPALLVILFFVTLLLKHHVLYAPTDFRSDESFTGLLVTVTGARRFAKLDQEAREVEASEGASEELAPIGTGEALQVARRDIRAAALLAEELVATALSKELGAHLERNVAFAASPNVILDAVATLPGRTIAVEVKYNRSGVFRRELVDSTFARLLSVYRTLPPDVQQQFEVVFAVVTDGDASRRHEEIKTSVTRTAEGYPFKTSVRLFDLGSLDSQLGHEVPPANQESQAQLEKRIVGILGAGRSRNLRQLLADLGVETGDRMAVASIQEAIGTLVVNGKIEHDIGSVDEYRLKKGS